MGSSRRLSGDLYVDLQGDFWVISSTMEAETLRGSQCGTCMATIALSYMGMDQYLLIPFLVGWTSIYQLCWCSPHTAISSYYLHCMYLHVTEFCTCSVPGHTDEFHWLGNKENLCGSVFGRSLPKTLQITRHWPLGPWAWKVAHGQLIETVCTWFIT